MSRHLDEVELGCRNVFHEKIIKCEDFRGGEIWCVERIRRASGIDCIRISMLVLTVPHPIYLFSFCLNDSLDQFFPCLSFLFHRFSTVSINLGPLRIAFIKSETKEKCFCGMVTYINGGSWMDGGRESVRHLRQRGVI